MRIGIDLMGSDNSPLLLFQAVVQASAHLDKNFTLVVIATKTVVDQLNSLASNTPQNSLQAAITFRVVADTIAMAEDPIGAIRRKKEASLVVGMRLLKKRQLEAFVSCGNTGALIASAALSLPMLPGVFRPALLASLPTEKGYAAVLDVGGNVSSKARYLVQFAHLGAAYQRAVQGIEVPTVGLLNVGAESKKGTTEVRQAYELLRNHCQDLVARGVAPRMHFIGNIEGRDLFKGAVDVIVTDGFTGNVLLKSVEGASSFIFSSLQEAYKGSSTFQELQKLFNYAEYPGAIVCGVEGVVIKAHGNASVKALFSSIVGAANCVQKNVITLLKEQLS